MKIRKTFFLVLVLSVFFSSCENSLADIINEQFGFTRPNQLIEDEDINSEEDKKHEDDNNSGKKESFEFTYSEWNWGYELSTAKIKSAVSKITTDYVVNYRINFISESNLDGIQIQVWEYEQETSLIQWPQISKAVTAGQEYEITGSLPVYSAGDFAKSIFLLVLITAADCGYGFTKLTICDFFAASDLLGNQTVAFTHQFDMLLSFPFGIFHAS